jgi:hypothetical protein
MTIQMADTSVYDGQTSATWSQFSSGGLGRFTEKGKTGNGFAGHLRE